MKYRCVMKFEFYDEIWQRCEILISLSNLLFWHGSAMPEQWLCLFLVSLQGLPCRDRRARAYIYVPLYRPEGAVQRHSGMASPCPHIRSIVITCFKFGLKPKFKTIIAAGLKPRSTYLSRCVPPSVAHT